MRRTLRLPALSHVEGPAPSAVGGPALRERFGAKATWIAVAVALLWALHPLQTESVTYVVQRAESLMGLFYLLTLHGLVRAVVSPNPQAWFAVSAGACLCGMASKEVMVSAPLIVLLFDRTFVAGTFAAAWRQRWKYYVALSATWILLGRVRGRHLPLQVLVPLGLSRPRADAARVRMTTGRGVPRPFGGPALMQDGYPVVPLRPK